MQDKVSEFLTYLKNYDAEKLRPKTTKLTGELFELEPIKTGIQSATGYVWSCEEMDSDDIEDNGFTPEDLEHNRGVNPEKVKVFEFHRKSKGRSELWLLRLVLMPGCAFISWNTGRVSGSTEIHKSIDGLLDELSEVS